MPIPSFLRAPIVAAAALLALPVAGCAGHAGAPATAPSADTFEIRSGVTGRDYIVSMARPRLPAPATGYPVLYVPADDAAFRDLAGAVQAGGKPVLVVGIGYPQGVDPGKAGRLDLTPSVSVEPPKDSGTGGAEDFLDVIERQLKPEIAGRFQIDREKQTLFGRSCAGLFALYALVNAPASFDTFVAVNPAIAFENRFLAEPQLRGRLGPKLQATQATPRVLLITDARTSTPPCESRPADTREFHEFLQSLAGISSEFVGFAGTATEWASPVIRHALGTGLARPQPAAKLAPPGAPGGIAVPTADQYRAMNPEQRYALRLRVRSLPKAQREVWTQQFNPSLSAGLTYRQHRRFYEERVAMDQLHGTRSPDN